MKSFMVRARACGVDYHSQFLKTGTVAVGWGGAGDLGKTSKENVTKNLGEIHNCIGHGAAAATTAIYGIYNAEIGDIVVMPVDRNIYIGRVTKTYWYDPADYDAAHIIGVDWNHNPVPMENLSDSLRSSLKNLRTFASLEKDTGELNSLLNGSGNNITLVSTGKSYVFKYGANNLISIAGIQDRIEEDIIDDICKSLKELLLKEGRLIQHV